MIVFLYVLVAILSLLVIGIILIQPSKSGGMGAAFGGIGESVFGAQAGSHLTKATVIMTGLLGSLPRVAASTVLGSALPTGDTGRMGLSLACGAVLTALSLLLWRQWRTH